MILGPSGQNIYPEEIEDRLNALPYVSESLVIEKDGKLIALVYPDYEVVKKKRSALSSLKLKWTKTVNSSTICCRCTARLPV